MKKHFRPYGKVGTNYKLIPKFCERKGDWDFALINLLALAYVSRDKDFLTPEAYKKLIFKLLNTNGSKRYTHFTLGICGRYEDTENHILMTEASRYLTNQLQVEYLKENNQTPPEDLMNKKNGLAQWWASHLKELKEKNFDEYNSRPYQGYAIMPITLLSTYAEDTEVKKSANDLLEYLSTIFLHQSAGGIRNVPFRRQLKYDTKDDLLSGDGEVARHAYLTGIIDFYPKPNGQRYVKYGTNFMLINAVTNYQLPSTLLKKFFNYSTPRFVKYNHQTPEIYYNSKSFTLSGGGRHVNRLDGATKENDGWARTTTLLLRDKPQTKITNHFRFKGHKFRLSRKNTCVHHNFACGLNYARPSFLPDKCGITFDNFKFYDLSSAECGELSSIYLAEFIVPCTKASCWFKAKNFGLVEIREASELSFNSFINLVLQNNFPLNLKLQETNLYKTTLGETIRFTPGKLGKNNLEIKNFDK